MNLEIMIPSCIVSIIIFSVLFNIGRNNFKSTTNHQFDLRNNFPYEMQNIVKGKFNWQLRFVAFLFATSLALFAINAFDLKQGLHLSMATGTMILSAIVIMLLFFVDMQNSSKHMILAILEMALTFLSFAFVANYVFFFNNYNYPLYMGIVTLILALFIILLIINPKLYKWMFLKRVENENGEISFERPKFIMLALYEWIFIFLNIILDLFITIVTVFM